MTNDESFGLKDMVFSNIFTIASMIETSFSEKNIFNNSFENCSTLDENLIKIVTSLPTIFDFISIKNCSTGFLAVIDSNVSIYNSTFDNNLLNYTLENSLISLETLNQNNITIDKCLFNNIHSFHSGAVLFI